MTGAAEAANEHSRALPSSPTDPDGTSEPPRKVPPHKSSLGVFPTVLVFSAPVALGIATGLLTGQTGVDSTVVAAVLPAVLTGGGGALLAFKLKTDNDGWARDYLVASAAVVLFSISLVLGVYSALYINDRAAYEQSTAATKEAIAAHELWRKHLVEDLVFRKKMIEQCSKNEALVNAGRRALALPPLPTDAFCDSDQLNRPNIPPLPATTIPDSDGQTISD